MLNFRKAIQNSAVYLNPFRESDVFFDTHKPLFWEVLMDEEKELNMRVIARRFLPPVNTADTNYFDKIHMESACLFFPEDTAYHTQSVWAEENNNSVKRGFEG